MNKRINRLLLLLPAMLIAGAVQAHADDGNLRGDANGDGVIDVTDASIVTDKYHNIASPPCPLNADANGDGVIDMTDVAIIIDLFHHGTIDAETTIHDWEEGSTSGDLQPTEGDSGD